MSAAISRNQASKQPPFPLKPMFEENDYPSKRLQHRLTLNNGHVDARKIDLSFCPDPSDKERLVTVLDDYKVACDVDQLNYQGADLHKHAIDVLGKDLRNVWTKKLTNVAPGGQSDADFVNNVREFLKTYLTKSAFQVQRQYMIHAKKPFSMDCYTLASRLRTINDLSVYLPGSGGSKLYPTDVDMKNAFYQLMLPKWQSNFDAAGHATDDANYTMDTLSSFMEQQRLNSTPANDRNRNGGRGRGRDRRYHPYGGRGHPPRGTFRQTNYNNGGGYPRNFNQNARNQGVQTPGGRGRGNQGRGFYRNQGTNTGQVRRGRSSGAPAPRQNSNSSREVRNLFFNGQEYVPMSSTPSNYEDNFYQEYSGEPDTDYSEYTSDATNNDVFYQEQNGTSEEYDQAGVPEDGFFNQDPSHEQHAPNQGNTWHQDAHDTYDY